MNEEQLHKVIADLHSTNTQHLNRVLACEAMLHSMVQLLDRQALGTLAAEYDQAIDRLATAVPPRLQQPAVWNEFSAAIEDRAQWLQRTQTGAP